MAMIDRLQKVTDFRRKDLPELAANAQDPKKDQRGSATAVLAGELRSLAIADYVLDNDTASFREKLSESAELMHRLFERFENGEPIALSWLSMLRYKELYDALASGDLDLAGSLAEMMLETYPEVLRRHKESETRQAEETRGFYVPDERMELPFDNRMGYCLCAFVLDDRAEMQKRAAEFAEMTRQKQNADFAGYAQMFHAILERDAAKAQQALERIAEGHKRQSKRGGRFEGTVDEVLCVWGIGIANLARWNGLAVRGVPPLIPDELLIDMP